MRRVLLLLVTVAGLLAGGQAMSQPSEPSPEELRALAGLLSDPAIQSWLQAQADRTPPGDAGATAAVSEPASAQAMMAGQLDTMRDFLRELAAAVPTLPGELGRALTTLAAEREAWGGQRPIVLVAMFVALGFGLEWLLWWATTGFRQRMIASPLETARDRLRAGGLRAAYGLLLLLGFATGSIGAFLLFDWPPVLKHIVLGYLLVFLIVRLVLVVGRILLAPGAERFRIIPMANSTARFWFVWSAVLIGWFFFVRTTLSGLAALGITRPAWYLVGLGGGVVLVGLALYVVWQHPARDTGERASHEHRLRAWLLSVYLVVVWLLLFTGSTGPFYVGVILLLLPIAIQSADLAVKHVRRPADSATADDSIPSLTAVTVERGLRAVLLIGGAYLIAWTIGLDLVAMTMRDTLATRLLRGAINAVVILLIADYAWRLARAWIDWRLAEAQDRGVPDPERARRGARLRTLLPILKNVLLVVLVAMAGLMALSALGVEIGPLIAGAGVVGVAIGFGAQTLVKDIISGMFYLLDDAFRVGEYIISSSYKGTVESFSLRSIKLRHHRGYLYTVPFGELGAIQNMSRDWVIDKLSVGVTYDTDIDKVKGIIKQIGKELQANPEFAPHIIETLKMQGVEQFGDFAIQIRMKMMTKPGEQFVIRRRAYGMIKKAFSANGIAFAFPTVTVAGGAGSKEAIAQKGLDLVRPPSPAA
jgi:small-conductance mechanosensitive channel